MALKVTNKNRKKLNEIDCTHLVPEEVKFTEIVELSDGRRVFSVYVGDMTNEEIQKHIEDIKRDIAHRKYQHDIIADLLAESNKIDQPSYYDFTEQLLIGVVGVMVIGMVLLFAI